MADGNGLFAEMRRLMEADQVPDDVSMAALWGALAVVYKNMDCKVSRDEFAAHKKEWALERKVWLGISTFLVLTHLTLIADWAEAVWKWFLTLA